MYLKAKPPPDIVFIEMTQLLTASEEVLQEIQSLNKRSAPLIACLLLNENEIVLIENLMLKIDYYLVMPDSMDLDVGFVKTMGDMADRVK